MEKGIIRLEGKKLVVMLQKELDHHNATAIKDMIDEYILAGKAEEVVFDFTRTSFMDSSGIGIIMGRYKLLKAIGGNIYVTNMDKNVERIFSISGLFKIVSKIWLKYRIMLNVKGRDEYE